MTATYSIEPKEFKYDMHCHIHEGSPDSHICAEDFIRMLIGKGFTGMLVTDHDSYDGWRLWRDKLKKKFPGFHMLKGIEYDTDDAGHIIVVMPTNVTLPLLEQRGLKVEKLIEIVHSHGGILGPAHPHGEPFLSIFRTGRFRRDKSIAQRFDFLEGPNACEYEKDWALNIELANRYDKAIFGGGDAHGKKYVGAAYSIFPVELKTEDDLIKFIKEGGKPISEGKRIFGTLRDFLGPVNKLLVYSFFFYNKYETLMHRKKRKELSKCIKKESGGISERK